MTDLPWTLIAGLATTGILMAVVSCFIGMRPKAENPAWVGLYVVWVAVVLVVDRRAPFLTIFIASTMAGLLHGTTKALLLDQYRRANPWHALDMQGPRGKPVATSIVASMVAGVGSGAVMGGVAWALALL